MLLALTGYELALLGVAAVFIAFALVVALVVPRTRPGFPGNRLGVFLGVCAALFVAQISAVLVLAYVGEANEPAAEAAPPPTETTTSETTTTETTATETTGTGTTTSSESTTTETTTQAGGQGDATAGKAIFTGTAGCGGCHTLADAGTSGAVGPNLDAVKPSFDKVVTQVTNGGGAMPAFKGTLTEQQIQDVAAYVSSVAGS